MVHANAAGGCTGWRRAIGLFSNIEPIEQINAAGHPCRERD
jgi:hypothetical protein